MNHAKPTPRGERVTENIWLCPDGVYRWTYEFDLLRNPTVLITVYQVLGIAVGIVLVFDLIVSLLSGGLQSGEDLLGVGKLFLILAGIMLVLGIMGYIIVAAVYGRKYQVLFEMTDESVRHTQMPKQFEKAEALGWLTAFAGAAAGTPAAAGAGLLAASKNTSVSVFKNVKSVAVRRKRHTIHLNCFPEKNQVYAEEADFDFVENYILERCVNAKQK